MSLRVKKQYGKKEKESGCPFCDAHDLALDVKWAIKDYYSATFINGGESLIIKFTNGQKFVIKVTELK